MRTSAVKTGARSATNVSLNAGLVAEAKARGINISQACERGLDAQVARARAEAWRMENAAAIAAYNDWIEEHGLPLADLRQF